MIYIIDGQEVSEEQAMQQARAMGLDFNIYLSAVGATLKQGGDNDVEQVNTQPSAFSQIIDGKSPEDFQQVTATEDVPAVTVTEDAPKPLEEIPTSELELQLEETSLAIAELNKEADDKGIGQYSRNHGKSLLANKLNKLKSKKERENIQLQVRYTAADNLDFSVANSVAGQTEDRVIAGMMKEFPYINVEATGAGNEIIIKNYLGTGKDQNVKLDGSEESKKVFKDLYDNDRALTGTSRVELTVESSLKRLSKDNDIVPLNKVIKSSGYEIQQVKIPGKSVTTGYGPGGIPITDYTPGTYKYSLTKDGVTIASRIKGIRDILKGDKKLEGAIVQEAVDIQTQALEKRAQAFEKEKEIITKDPTTTVDYYEDGSFEKDIIKAIQDKGLDLSSEEIQTVQDYFKSINARVGGVEVEEDSVMAQFPSLLKMADRMGFVDKSSSKNYISDKEKVEIYRNLSGLPLEIIEKIKASGFLPTVKKKVAEIAHQKAVEKSETIFEDLIKAEGDQGTIQLAQRFIGAERKDVVRSLETRADKVVEQREKQATIFSAQAKNIIENVAPEGAKIGLMAAGGSSQIGLQMDRELTKEEQKQFDKAADMLMALQYSMDLLQSDYVKTISNIQRDFQIYAAEDKGIDQGLFNTSSKEYGLANLLVKDINDSFAGFLLSVPTLLDSDWANLEQQKLNRKNSYYETARAYDDGDFGRYVLRTTAQQSANIVVAIATGGAGGALNLTRMGTQLAIGTVFGVSSGTQTFRDLSSQNTIYDLAKLRGEQATRAKTEGIISDYAYTQIMQDVNNTLAMGRLSNTQVMGASFTNGVIEGSVMTLIGQAPNTLKLLKDFRTPTQIAEISKNLFSKYGRVGQLYNYIGKPLVTRPLGEVVEEGAVYGLQQYITEYGILDRELDLSQWDDTAMAAITTSGLTQSPGIAYSGMITYGKTKQYEKTVNGLRNINTNLSQLIQNTKNEKDRKALLDDMSGILEDMGLETDMLSIDILNLGAKDVKRLIGNSLIRQDVLAEAGVPYGSSEAKTAEILNAYKATLSSQEVEDFDNQLNAIDTQISRIKEGIEKPGGYKLAKQSLGNIYTQYNSRFEKEGVVFKNDREKLAKIVQRFRQDMVDSNLERAKKDKFIIKAVEAKRTEDGKELNEAQKEALYASYGQMFTETRGRAVASRINLDTAVDDIFEKGSNVDVVAWETKDDLLVALDAVTVINEKTGKREKLSKEDYNDAYSKLLNNETFGLIVGNKLITQNEADARADLERGVIRAGTVKLHELTHVINDGRITTRKGKTDYANNLFKAASTSDNLALRGAHEQVMRDLNDIYESRKMTFENSEAFRDEYTTHLQEKLYAKEDQMQLEKDESFLVKAFNDLTTNANSLNTPERALNFLLANNSGFRNGKLSRKSQRAIKNRDGGKLKTSEKNSVNKLAEEYKENKDAFMKNPEKYGDLFMQFQSVALDAMGYNVGKGDIVAEDAMGYVATEFESIMKNYNTVVKGQKVAFTTYVNAVFQRGRANDFYKQELESKKGRTSITSATESTRLVSTDTAESGLSLEERKAREKKSETKRINPLSAKEIGSNRKAIEDAVVITPAMAPIADFKSISKDYGGKVASIIFNIPETKIDDGAKNLTYAKKIVDGVPEPSEAGNIQNLYSDTQLLARDIKLLPDTNVTSEESRVGEQGEKVPVTRNVQGRSLGLPNRIIKYFYEDTGKRSKGTTSQTKVYRKKSKFDNPTPQVLKEVQREMGITPAGQLNQYNRTIGQFLKGFAKVKGSVAAVAVAKNKVAALDTKTSKGKKQIEADIGAGRSKIQFSEKGKGSDLVKAKKDKEAIKLALKMEEIAKTSRLLDSPIYRSTIKMMNADGIFTVADMKNKIGVNPKPGDELKNIKKSGYRVLSGQLDVAASILNKFLETNPRHYKILKQSLTNGTRVGLFGTVEVWSKMINLTPEIKNEIKRDNYTTNKKQKPGFVKETNKPDFVKDQYAKLGYFESFWKDVETFLKEGDNMSYAWVWQELLVDTVDNMKGLNRIAPPVLYLALDKNGNIDYDSGIREEHNFPSNNIGTLMLWAAMNGEMENTMKVVSAAYMQGPILLTDDRRIDATSVQGQFSKDHYKFAKKISGGLSVNMPDFFWKTVVPRILSGELIIPEGLGAVPRLSAANVNLDSYKFLPEDMTMSEYFFGTNGVPTETKLKGIATQDQIIKEFFSGEITLKEARAKGRQAVAVINKLDESFKPDSSKTIEYNNTADKAMANARDSRKYKESSRKARVFDFDDTLAQSNSMVIVNMPDGTSRKINATEFALEAGDLEQQGAEFDFVQFNQVIDGKKGPLFEVAKFISEAEGQRDMFVLTARPAASAVNIKEFLDGLGLNIPIENIVGLGDGKAKAKADWFVEKYSEGYNDFYFADDALKNVKAVKDIFNVLDVKSQVQQARVKFSEKMSTEFNDMIERNKGIKSQATFSDVQARRRGTKQKKYSFFIPPSADDFRGLTMYTFAGKGKQGEADQEFFDKALVKPYQAGVAAINRAKFRIRTDYGALVKNNKRIAKRLKNTVAGTNHTLDEAIRVYLWNKEGYDIPGMSKRDVDALVGHVESGTNGELIAYAEGVKLVTRQDTYPEPSEYWDGSTILGDLNNIATETNRAEYLKEFVVNSKVIFSPENLNKVEAVYGFRVRESIENILFRMETGQNKAKGSGRIVNEWNDWVNNSVGAIMFFNRRSALMQTLSTVNFVNWSDNNPIKAAAAFANQPQYWKDFSTLWSSPKLVARRSGLESDIQEAEIARAAKKGGVKGVISYLLKIGFTPTQLADSFAIASGGATYYRNRTKSYLKETNDQGEKVYTKEQAEQKAFEDFSSIAEETQQSGDPMLVSQQQASVLGRLVLAFQNTPMQYTRLIKKASQDLINRRGNPMTSVSKIVYYGFVQNLIFSTLQNALFALIPGFDDEEEDFKTDKEREKYLEKQQRKKDKKVVRVANSMVDTLLRGSGLAGAVVSTIKNVIMAYQRYDEAPMIQKENADIILAALNISPPIGSKARKINNVLQTMQFEKDVLAERGFSVMIDGRFQLSPAYDMLGDITSATLNLPIDRLADEVNAITEALDTRNTQWQRIALALGWRQWDVGARAEEHDLIKTEAKAKRKVEGKAKAKETRRKNKELKEKNNNLRNIVLNNMPNSSRVDIQAKESKTGFKTPVYKLKELAKEYNIDISDYE